MMLFKNPQVLYFLLFLAIPIVVHLFRLRKFERVPFTQVNRLKKVEIQTRRSSRLKKWLTLLCRMLAVAALILAFAQPYLPLHDGFLKQGKTAIYLDNSFSMQARGSRGELLEQAKQELLLRISPESQIGIFTNDNSFSQRPFRQLKEFISGLDYYSEQLSAEEVLLKATGIYDLRGEDNDRLIWISDFKGTVDPDSLLSQQSFEVIPIRLEGQELLNFSVDTAYFKGWDELSKDLVVELSSNQSTTASLPVALYLGTKLISKTSVDFKASSGAQMTFSLSGELDSKGRIVIEDDGLSYDNQLFFSINHSDPIKVMVISEVDTDFLDRIFGDTTFNYTRYSPENLVYSQISEQQIVILDELNNISNALAQAIKSFHAAKGTVVFIPSALSDPNNYNRMLRDIGLPEIDSLKTEPKQITQINFDDPLYEGVFSERIQNFQYPELKAYFPVKSKAKGILSMSDGAPFLLAKEEAYLFSSPLNSEFSNFINSPLIVPTFYRIGLLSLKPDALYYELGKPQQIDVSISLGKDQILVMQGEKSSFIPLQQNSLNKVKLFSDEDPRIAGYYSIMKNTDTIKTISYNYNRSESKLNSFSKIENNSFKDLGSMLSDIIEGDHITSLWKWFVIFALSMLLIEGLLLKFLP